jgi:hypothetical protein
MVREVGQLHVVMLRLNCDDPNAVFAIRIKWSDMMTAERLKSGDACEVNWPALHSRQRQEFGRGDRRGRVS